MEAKEFRSYVGALDLFLVFHNHWRLARTGWPIKTEGCLLGCSWKKVFVGSSGINRSNVIIILNDSNGLQQQWVSIILLGINLHSLTVEVKARVP
eukprot:scaffold38031_cov573-Amphora_coffeaeformis.AAC.1